MKQLLRIPLFLALIASSLPSWSQSQNAIAEFVTVSPHFGKKTIVRNWKDGYVLSYAVENNDRYLYLVNVDDMSTESNPSFMNVSGYKVLLRSDINVNDIQIDDNIVYFCGSNSTNGIYGCLKLTDITSLNLSVTIQYYDVIDVRTLNKMVAYTNSSGVKKIVMAGSKYVYPATLSYIIDVSNAFSNFPTYEVFLLPYNVGINNEEVYDLVLTQFNVVIIGNDYLGGASLLIRVVNRDNFSPSMMAGQRYVFSLPSDEIIGSVCATVVDSLDTIAIAYVHLNASGALSTRVRQMVFRTNKQLVHSQEYSIDDKYSPYEISFDRRTRTLTVLQNDNQSNLGSKFHLLKANPIGSYLSDYLYYPGIEFMSIYNWGYAHFVSTGISHSFSSKFWYVQSLLAPVALGSGCHLSSQVMANMLPDCSSYSSILLPGSNSNGVVVSCNNESDVLLAPTVICNLPRVLK